MRHHRSAHSVLGTSNLLFAVALFATTSCGSAESATSDAPRADEAPLADTATKGTLRVKNVILVHGAWADGSSWSKVIPRLAADGLHVTAVQMPLTSLSDDVATVQRALAREDGPVVLVGHSYGGAVITEAGNDPKVTALVYVAAFAPDSGESIGSLTATVPPAPASSETQIDASGFITVTFKGIVEDIAQDLTTAEQIVLTAVQGPIAGSSFATPISTAAWQSKRSWYIVATDDRAIPPELEAKMAKRIGARTISIASSHAVMASHPKRVAAVIEEAMRAHP